ncbi:dynein axonemal intermediate chain 4 isoform X4 [Ursus americanus]|uniref:dynein axonemal intermediate chain 4 isoform X4 n=1 Tax=Ursus americanus TaxID=9643 RepID=UPI001E67DB8F|nr:dynein axonemal intermediate chain 4 isoform X4 [Ursus americanus]
MPISPVNSRKQQNLWLSVGPQPKKSISFTNTVKGGQTKGYIGANQSRMAMSKTLMVLPEIKTEKMNISTPRTVIQVINALGVDVTPRPLYHQDPHMGTAKPNKLLTSQEGSYASDYISSYSLYQNTINPSMLGQFTRSVLGSSSVSKSSVSTTESIAEDLEEPSYKREKLTSFTGVMSSTWDLYDSYNAMDLSPLPTKQSMLESTSKASIPSKDREQRVTGSTIEKNSEASSLMDIENVILTKIRDDEEDHSESIMKSDKFRQDLFFMERVLMENLFQPKLAAYHQLPVLKEPEPAGPEDFLEGEKLEQETEEEVKKEEEEEIEIGTEESTIPANLERLWSFSCDLTKGLNVSSLAWNKTNPDLLAVGYGHFGFKEQKRGLACCWSIKNPMWPERIYQSPYGVTAVDFSIGAPNLLAVGYHNGTIAIYNVQSNSNVPVLDSSESPLKHLGPVWQLQWIEQDRGTTGDDKREILVSISADGRISKWVIRKGLDCHDLMRLRRTTASSSKKGGEKEKKGEALISRQAPGMCFAFHPKDTNIYLAGTEEGHIHKCSCSYNEQYLDTYRGHKGPVYKIAWNPFCHDVFLSCSADWGVIIWQQENTNPFLSFYPTTYVVYDVAWSPKSSCVFAVANESRVEIWDLHVSTLDPLIVNVANPGIKFTTVLFAKQTDCLLVGDSDGQVAVYELRNMPTALDSGRVFAQNIGHILDEIFLGYLI